MKGYSADAGNIGNTNDILVRLLIGLPLLLKTIAIGQLS